MKKQMIKRADGSYSQRGLWDNIRANRGSGKKPTKKMLKQEKKIKANMAEGGLSNPGFKALPSYVQAKIRSNMQMGGMSGSPVVDMINQSGQPAMMQVGGMMPQSSAGQSVLQEAMTMSQMQSGGKMPSDIARARFMAAANGNASKAKETASKYGYKMQVGGFRSSNPSTSDNTMAPNPAMMAKRRAEGQAFVKKVSTPQGQAQMAAAKKRAETNIAATKAKQEQQATQKAAQAKAKEVADMQARIDDSKKVQDLPISEQFTPENIARATQATGDKLRLFGPESPLVTSGLFEADPNSFVDNYLNPAKFVGDMATNLGQGIEETANTGDFTAVGKALATPIVAGATMGYLKSPVHSLEKKLMSPITKRLNSTSISAAMVNPSMTGAIGAGTNLVGKGINQSIKQAGVAAEHDVVHRTTAPFSVVEHKKGGSIRDMYMMKKGGQFPERYKKMGFRGVDQPKKTTSGNKSHAVVTKVDGNYKLIRFGQKGEVGSPDGSARNKAFKARHAKNIAKGKSSAAYWANKVKW
jgi:hypothetical protein